MKKEWLAYMLIASLLVSCQERKIQKEVEKLYSVAVVVPSEISQVLFGRDTVLFRVDSSAARLVVYTDSLSCSPCRLNYMFEYNDILALHQELGNEFRPVFIFSPTEEQVSEVRNTLSFNSFDYPVLLDDKGLFPAANPHIPADNQFHTFLLDRAGKVVLAGNPVENEQLWALYKDKIRELVNR